MTNKEKLQELVTGDDSALLDQIKGRIARQKTLRRSKSIAFRILVRLDELGLSQKDIAEKLNVSPQQVNKWVRGKENFTLETIERIENALGIELIYIQNEEVSDALIITVDYPTSLNTDYSKMELKSAGSKIIPLNQDFSLKNGKLG